jgi:uncharacterized protein
VAFGTEGIGGSIYSYSILVDTGAFLARVKRDDQNHRLASETFVGLRETAWPLLVSRPTLWEAYTRIRYDVDYGEAQALLAFVEENVEIVEFEVSDDAIAREWLRQFPWVRLSFVDALNFAIMDRLGVRAVFTFDVNDYSMRGFEVFPQT